MVEQRAEKPKPCHLRADWEATLTRGDYSLEAKQGVDDQRAEVSMTWHGRTSSDPKNEARRLSSLPFSIGTEDLRSWCLEVLRLTGGVP